MILTHRLLETLDKARKILRAVPGILAMAILLSPYYNTLTRTFNETENVRGIKSYYEDTNLLREQVRENQVIGWKFIDDEYSAHNWWYIQRLNDLGGSNDFYRGYNDVTIGDTVLVYRNHQVYSTIQLLEPITGFTNLPKIKVFITIYVLGSRKLSGRYLGVNLLRRCGLHL